MIDEPLVLVERPVAGCAVVTLNRPRVKNALSRALRRDLVSTFEMLAREDSVRVVVLTGAGTAFCAGVDLKELGSSPDPASAVVPDAAADPVSAIRRFPWPVIGAINGPAITGGFELALACDLLIASRSAAFADTHARVGVLPGWGLSQRLPRLIGPHRAKELSFTGNFLRADTAEAWGLVNRVVPPDELMPVSLALAMDMLGALPEMLAGYKRLIDDGFDRTLAEGLVLEKERSRTFAATVSAGDIEARRHAIARRGRAQHGRDGGGGGDGR
ncbi:MAG: enoyl-CoA hydratase [Betaproteobacteria bacterium]|nr:enoyl-CoA hydratase [Betaproteobacteria bacterium]